MLSKTPSTGWRQRYLTAREAPNFPKVVVVVGVALVLVLVTTLLTLFYDATVSLALPLALVIIYAMLFRPFTCYVILLCSLAVLPMDGQFLGFHVPNWAQLMIPGLVLGALLTSWREHSSEAMKVQAADIFVVAFLAVAYTGIYMYPDGQLKYFTNQQAFPALLYFVARWLPLDRQRFMTELRVVLAVVGVMGLYLIFSGLTGLDPFYRMNRTGAIGMAARGAMYSLSDSAAFFSVWPAFLIYAASRRLPLPLGKNRPGLWMLGALGTMAAAAATQERTAFLAIAAVILVLMFHRRMMGKVIVILIFGAVIAPILALTVMGSNITGRFDEESPALRRGLYRDKAIGYIMSPHWDPLFGTGFARLKDVSMGTIPPDQWVYEPASENWRAVEDISNRAIHCAPVVVFGEYGLLGVAALLGVVCCVIFAFMRAARRARLAGLQFDSMLMVAAFAAFATVVANGWFHNTNNVMQVVCLLWSFIGTIVGHPEMLMVAPSEEKPR